MSGSGRACHLRRDGKIRPWRDNQGQLQIRVVKASLLAYTINEKIVLIDVYLDA